MRFYFVEKVKQEPMFCCPTLTLFQIPIVSVLRTSIIFSYIYVKFVYCSVFVDNIYLITFFLSSSQHFFLSSSQIRYVKIQFKKTDLTILFKQRKFLNSRKNYHTGIRLGLCHFQFFRNPLNSIIVQNNHQH